MHDQIFLKQKNFYLQELCVATKILNPYRKSV